MNEYQTYEEWVSNRDGLFETIHHVMALPFFTDYTPVDLDETFKSLYNERMVSKAFSHRSSTEVAIQLIMRFSHKWNELYEWYQTHLPLNVTRSETYSETIVDENLITRDNVTTDKESAFNDDSFVNDTQKNQVDNESTDGTTTKEYEKNVKSLSAYMQQRSRLYQDVFIDTVFKDVITMLCLSIY